ncbi:MAG: alpha/beta fold hydrolase, partial [Mycobacterium sp.]
MPEEDSAALPVGFLRFHRRPFINYQLNRAHALGYADRDELAEVAGAIQTCSDCVDGFDALSRRAEREGRLKNATSYLRLAEFFTPHRSPQKLTRYRQYRRSFDIGFADTGVVRLEVPYESATLPTYMHPAAGTRCGTVLLHGGFDSLIEEFFAISQRIAAAGFDVIAFDGPGQGGARRLGGLTFDHDWEKPVRAVLDRFGLERAALVGISMG